MKKVCFILISMLSGFICSAQVLWGVQGGMNISKLKINHRGYVYTEEISSPKAGFVGGVVVEAPITKHIHFRPELNYIQKEGKFPLLNTYNRFGKKIQLITQGLIIYN